MQITILKLLLGQMEMYSLALTDLCKRIKIVIGSM